MRKVLAASAAGVMLAFGLVFTAASASAAPGDTYPGAGWELIDTKVDGSNVTRGPAASSKILSKSAVQLGRTDKATGTSIESANLDVSVDAGDKLTVAYQLDGAAKTSAGAVRMFYYDKANADTMTEAPKGVAIAPDDKLSGTLTLDVSSAGKLGTFGLVWDSSNDSVPGTATFKNLTVTKARSEDSFKVVFVPPLTPVKTKAPKITEVTCDGDVKVETPQIKGVKYDVGKPTEGTVTVTATAEPGFRLVGDTVWALSYELPKDCETPTPNPTDTGEPEPTATATGTATPTQSQTAVPAPSTSNAGNGGGNLPVTGPSGGIAKLLTMFGIGLGMVAVGGLGLVWARRRRDEDAVESA